MTVFLCGISYNTGVKKDKEDVGCMCVCDIYVPYKTLYTSQFFKGIFYCDLYVLLVKPQTCNSHFCNSLYN